MILRKEILSQSVLFLQFVVLLEAVTKQKSPTNKIHSIKKLIKQNRIENAHKTDFFFISTIFFL